MELVSAQEVDVSSILIDKAYDEYQKISKDFILNQQETMEVLRNWRKSMLVESYSTRLDNIEKNLNLSNTNLIENFETFIKENGESSLDDVLMIRLAQLNFEKANLDFNANMKKYQQRLDLYTKGLISEAPEPPIPDFKKTIQISQEFVKNFPNSPLLDKSYYLIGFCLEEMMRDSEALPYYEKIVSQFPNSSFFDEVAWRSADIYFNSQKYESAEVLYQRLVEVKSSYQYKALYKLGAVHFAKKNYQRATQVFELLVGNLVDMPSRSLEESTLLEEGYDYLAAILSQDSKTQINSKYRDEVIYRLGQIYKKRLDEESMKSTYMYAVQEYPKSPWIPRMYSELITVFDDDGNEERVNFYRNKLIQLLTANNQWWSANEVYKLASFEAQDLLEFHLLKSAQFYANKGYKSNSYDLLETARSRYFNFITKYSWSPFAERAKLELADIEYFLERYAIASKYYFELVNEAESFVIREEAAYSLIWSESKKVKYDLSFNSAFYLARAGEKTQLSLQENVFIQAANYYAAKVPRSNRRNKVLYKVAEIYASKGQLDFAIQALNTIVSDLENSDFTSFNAYRLLADIYNIKNDWKSVQVVMELQKSSSYAPSQVDQDKENLLARNREKLEKGLSLELEGSYSLAAEEFERFILDNSRSSAVPIVQLKLAALYDKLHIMTKLQETIVKLERTSFVAEAMYLKAQMLSKQSLFDDAAKLFEEFSLQHPKHNWFEAAAMNAVSIRSQMRQHQLIIDYFKKANLSTYSPYLFYAYLNSLYELKRYDEVIKSTTSFAKKGEVDSSRLLNYILKSYFAKDDFINLSKTCPSVKALDDSKNKTAYLNYNLAFCQFVDLRAIVTVPETRMDQIQVELNEIAAYRVDEVIVNAVNIVLELSDLKNTNKDQFQAFAQKGWELARQTPFSLESKRLAKNYFQIFSKYPIHLGQLMNWRLSLNRIYDYRTLAMPEWKTLQVECQRDTANCVKGLESLLRSNASSADVFENLILAYINRGDDVNAVRVLKAYSQQLDWPQMAIDLHYVMGISNQIPQEKLKYEGQLSSPLGIMAVIEREIEAKNYKEALKFIRLNVGVNPFYPQTYARAALLYYERGFPELARTVLNNGYLTTQSPLIESLLYQINAVTYSNTNVGRVEVTQDLGPIQKYALAFAAIKNKDTKTFDQMRGQLKLYEIFDQNLVYTQNIYSDSKLDIPESSFSYHAKWMLQLYKFSHAQNPLNFENLKDVQLLGYKHPGQIEVDQISNFRAPAGGL